VLSGVDHAKANLVLCHNPDVADLPVWSGYRGWILSGHTHGGQGPKPPFFAAARSCRFATSVTRPGRLIWAKIAGCTSTGRSAISAAFVSTCGRRLRFFHLA